MNNQEHKDKLKVKLSEFRYIKNGLNYLANEIGLEQSFPILSSNTDWRLGARVSPSNETSLVKKIDLSLLEKTKEAIREFYPNIKFVVKYRGPRRKGGRYETTLGKSMCLKKDATSATLYLK